MSRPHSRVAALIAATGLFALGCPDQNGDPCGEECERGFQCDPVTGQCLPSPVPEYQRDIPAFAGQLASSGELHWLASIDPSDGGLIVTEYGETDHDARVIATPTMATDRRVALDASGRLLGVAWLGATGRYELAFRDLPSSHSVWTYTTIVEPEGTSYSGTQDFDLEVVGDRGIALAFRGRNRTLQVLSSADPATDDPWVLETVDDGSETDDGVSCPDELRRISPALGVGFHPDIEARGQQLHVAYHDADCGDLRFATRGAEQWAVTSADTGDVDTTLEAQRGYVGKWPSVAFDPSGAVRIAYHDVSRGRLLLASRQDAGFEISVIDPGFSVDAFSRQRKKSVGAFAQLSIDAVGIATVTYLDATLVDLRMARREAGATEWSREALQTAGAVGYFADHTRLPDGALIVSAAEVTVSPDGRQSTLVLLERDR